MANPEHLKILKQGVKAWNKWRKENPGVRPDLSGAILSDILSRSELLLKDLYAANLDGGKVFIDPDSGCVRFDNGRKIRFKRDLHQVDLSRAKLMRVDFSGANLSAANLRDANLREANLNMINLSQADLSGGHLYRAFARKANLVHAKLGGAYLTRSDLSGANLGKAHLVNADLRYCRIIRANLISAKLTGAKLYGTARDNWIIKNIECKYVYWDMEGQHRSPNDRDLDPGEFERLYAALPTIEYIFEHGMSPLDPVIMNRVVEAIRDQRPEFDIKIDSINARGLAPSIKFTVQHEEQKEPAFEEVRKGYEIKLKQLESERDRYWQIIKAAFDKPREVKLITAGPGAIVATDGSTINIQQHIHNVLELQKAIAQEPENSKTFTKVAKNKALDIIGKVLEDIAKGEVKEAAKQIIELGKDLGPLFVRMAPVAYEFFKNMIT